MARILRNRQTPPAEQGPKPETQPEVKPRLERMDAEVELNGVTPSNVDRRECYRCLRYKPVVSATAGFCSVHSMAVYSDEVCRFFRNNRARDLENSLEEIRRAGEELDNILEPATVIDEFPQPPAALPGSRSGSFFERLNANRARMDQLRAYAQSLVRVCGNCAFALRDDSDGTLLCTNAFTSIGNTFEGNTCGSWTSQDREIRRTLGQADPPGED